MMSKGEKLICNGTENHIVMWDLRPHDITGSKMQELLDRIHITTNKNSLVGDKSAITPGGVRLGTPALTTRGMKEDDMVKIGGFLVRTVEISKKIQSASQGKKLADFINAMETQKEELQKMAHEVESFAQQFEMPGV